MSAHFLQINGNRFFLVLAGLLFSTVPEASGIEQSNWRFFDVSDGLEESWSSHITLGPEGKVWISHGRVDSLSWLDGWPSPTDKFARKIASPGVNYKVFESRSGQLWSHYPKGFQLFIDGRWKLYELNETSDLFSASITTPMNLFLPGGRDQIYYLLPDRIMLLNAATGQKEIVKKTQETKLGRFIQMIPARKEGIWVTGEKGIAWLETAPGKSSAQWIEYLAGDLKVKDFQAPVEGADGEIFCVAVNLHKNKKELVHFDGIKWRILPSHEEVVLRGWPGLDESYWLWSNKQNLFLVQSGEVELQEKEGILSGDLHDITVEQNGIFWLSTSHGIARYAPFLWRTPIAINDVKDRIHAGHEDSKGRIWFGTVYGLLCFKDGEWKKYVIPEGLETQYHLTQSICSLPDGRILIASNPYHDFLLSFDPEKEKFGYIYYHSEDSLPGRTECYAISIAPRRDGTVWVETWTERDSIYRIETFDGKTFKPFLKLGNKEDIGNFRYLLEAKNGDLWLGGSSERGPSLYRNGKGRIFSESEGYKGGSAFCICELKNGNIWVGGRSDIFEFDGNKWRVVLSGLSGVRSMITGGDESIWVASGTGIHRYFNGTWVTYTIEDGLPNTAVFSIFEDHFGRVWAGTISGLSLYHPEADPDPPLTIISERDNLRETPPDGEVRLIFSGYDKWKYTYADRLLFSSRLDNGEWSPFKTGNVAVFSKLPYGRHRFEARAMDVNLNYEPEPAAFEFTVLLPWYKETGFQMVAGIGSTIIICLLGYVIHRHVVLEKLVIKRTKDLQQANVTLKEEHARLELTLKHERLLGKTASLLNSADSFQQIMDEVLGTTGRSLELDGACFHRIDDKLKVSVKLYCWNSGKSKRPFGCPQAYSHSEVPGYFSRLIANKMFVSSNVLELPEEEKEFFSSRNIGALITCPLSVAGRLKGSITYLQSSEREWERGEIKLFKTIADMIINAWEKDTQIQARLEADKKKAEAVQMAERAARMASIGVLAGSITHEITQPFNTIKVIVDSVCKGVKRDSVVIIGELLESLEAVSRQIFRVGEIITHVREFWVSPADNMEDVFELSECVKHALSLIEHQIFSHGIALDMELDSAPLPIKGNHILLEQVVINLVVNSMQAFDKVEHPDKKIKIFTRLQNDSAVLEVMDNGTGLRKEDVNKLFDPFYSTKKPGKGTGLGLAIVKKYIDKVEGSIEARNNENGGALFIVKLPLCPTSKGIKDADTDR